MTEQKEIKLTKKQRDFVHWYLVTGTAQTAARKAGYKDKAGGKDVYVLLRNPKIQLAIRQAQADRETRIHLTQDRVVNHIASLALSNIGDYLEEDENGLLKVKPLKQIEEDKMAAIQHLKQKEDGTLEIKLYDKKGPLTDLAAHMGVTMLPDRKEDSAEEPKKIVIVDRRSKVLEVVDEPKSLPSGTAASGVKAVSEAKVVSDQRTQ